MTPEDYGAQGTTLDNHIDMSLNPPNVIEIAREIPVFYWPDNHIARAAIPILYDTTNIIAETTKLLPHITGTHVGGSDKGYIGLKIGESYIQFRDFLDCLTNELDSKDKDMVTFTAEHRESRKCLQVVLSREVVGLRYKGKPLEAPEGECFVEVHSRDTQDQPIRKVFTVPEVLYLKAISLKQ